MKVGAVFCLTSVVEFVLAGIACGFGGWRIVVTDMGLDFELFFKMFCAATV